MSPNPPEHDLADWKVRAEAFERELGNTLVGLQGAIRLITTAVFARGHVMLEGDVGVGKTTLLRAVARCIGGAYERIEGTIDLMPNDLIYHTYINREGRPQVDPGVILKHGDKLSTFFFNEVNRARPQVHSLLLRVMAERSITAFNREYTFPHLQVFADRNRVEKEETFEMPSAARDRFMMELNIEIPEGAEDRKTLMFNPRFHDVDRLMDQVRPGLLPFEQLNAIAGTIQQEIRASDTLERYALDLWEATRNPVRFGISIDSVDMRKLILAGASARAMSMLLRAARVTAWLNERSAMIPEDIQSVFYQTIAHRIFFHPTYEIRREQLIGPLMRGILQSVASP
ncbi:MAG: MoxR family ATPase [Methylococcaceae bacterium]|nr:MoxR family ATPase [Methylococcaceae bacterium]